MARILVVDDEEDVTELLGAALESEGYQFEAALNAEEAIQKIKETAFDLVLLDIRLPQMNGVNIFLKLKGIDPAIKVIMMSAFPVSDLIEQALQEGAYGCLHKPFEFKKALELVKQVLSVT
ncbi:MAG: response regulator [bacterium]